MKLGQHSCRALVGSPRRLYDPRIPATTRGRRMTQLTDPFGRRVTYLRISVTDRCDFRCVYCMGDDMQFLPRAQLLSLEEIYRIAAAFCALGVDKIRVTGGEPLVRQNLVWLLERIAALPGLRELVLTTNGSQLERLAGPLRAAGVARLNISLDSLRPERFRRLTRNGDLEQVLRGIEAARQAGFTRTKLNVVALKNYNDDEVADLVRFAQEREFDISFIEEMPLGQVAGHDRVISHYPAHELRRALERHFTLLPSTETSGGPARYYRIPGSATRIGFITPHSHNFCDTCNRVRLTTEGRLLLCLGQENSVDLRRVVRAHPTDDAPLYTAITQAMRHKPRGHDFSPDRQTVIVRHMSVTGG